jgi:hypothetical protein
MYGCGAVQAGRTLSVDVEQQRERERVEGWVAAAGRNWVMAMPRLGLYSPAARVPGEGAAVRAA